MWSEGSIKLGSDIFHYWVKHYDEGSQYGIDEGPGAGISCAGSQRRR